MEGGVKNRNLVFAIEGRDFQTLEGFKKEHGDCLEKHPNMTAAQYEYSFIPDGVGVITKVTCCCGKSVLLSAGYDETLWGPDREPGFHVYPEEDKTAKILKILKEIQKRPGLFFGNKGSYRDLRIFLGGLSQGLYMDADESFWIDLEGDAYEGFSALTDEREYSDREKFDLYLDAIFKAAERKCPEYLKDMGVDT